MTGQIQNRPDAGQVVRELRGHRSQSSVATAMRARGWRWSQATMWAIEKGQRPIKMGEVVDLAAVLHVTIPDLLAKLWGMTESEVATNLAVMDRHLGPHTSPEAEARAEAKADNPALATETVAKAEQRAEQGWPWPVSGDATAILQPGKIPWGVKRRGRLK